MKVVFISEEKVMKRLEGKTALVTAAGQGIGRASVFALARAGAKVWATDINESSLEVLLQEAQSDGLEVETALLHVRDASSVQQLAHSIGHVDVLFNCAGFVASGSILEATEEDFDFSMDLNVKSMFHTIRAFLPSMLELTSGYFINMSLAAYSFEVEPYRLLY